MPEDVAEVPVLNPLVEGSVLDMPACAGDQQCRSPGHFARAFADDRETPSRRCFAGLGDHGADHADFSLVGVERVDIVRVPELDMFFLGGIVVLFAWSLALP